MCLYNLQLYLRLGLKLEKIRQVLELNQTHTHTRTHTYIYIYTYIYYILYIYYIIYIYIEFTTQKRIEAGKNNDKDGKALYKLMDNAIYRKQLKT